MVAMRGRIVHHQLVLFFKNRGGLLLIIFHNHIFLLAIVGTLLAFPAEVMHRLVTLSRELFYLIEVQIELVATEGIVKPFAIDGALGIRHGKNLYARIESAWSRLVLQHEHHGLSQLHCGFKLVCADRNRFGFHNPALGKVNTIDRDGVTSGFEGARETEHILLRLGCQNREGQQHEANHSLFHHSIVLVVSYRFLYWQNSVSHHLFCLKKSFMSCAHSCSFTPPTH